MRPVGTVERLIRLWNEVCSESFAEVRAALKDISADSLAAVADAKLVGASHIYSGDVNPPQAVAFIDDDDWFAPRLAAHLDEIGPDWDIAIWRSVQFDGTWAFRKLDRTCYTNNYAVRGELLNRGKRQKDLAHQHWRVRGLLKNPTLKVALIDVPLSVTLRHPASVVVLERLAGSEFSGVPIRNNFQAFVEHVVAEVPMPPGLEWSAPFLAALRRWAERLARAA